MAAAATDAAGNTANDTTADELTIDTTPPTTPTVNAQNTTDNTPTITGTADSSDALVVAVNGITYTEGDGNLVDNGNNTWSLTIPNGNALPDGVYDVAAIATDTAGNTANDTTTNELAIEVSPPTTMNTNQSFCAINQPTIADIQINETNINWYDSATGGNLLGLSTSLIDGTSYYAAQVGINSESSTRLQIIVSVNTVPTPTTNNVNQSFCGTNQPTIADIQVNETNVIWYDSPSGGNALTPSTSLVDGATYYAVQVNANCESASRMAITVQLDNNGVASINSNIATVCIFEEITYTTEANMQNYSWAVDGGSITGGGSLSDNFVTVHWESLSNTSLSVSYTSPNGCSQNNGLLNEAIVSCSDLTITKEASNLSPLVDETITFTITVFNDGLTDFSNVIVKEPLPSGFAFLKSNTSDGVYDSSNGTWTITNLKANQTAILIIDVKVNPIGNYVNIASIESSSPIDNDLDNNAAEVTVELSCLTVFNEFTPNNDGFNDYFRIECIENYPSCSLHIYNRYGSLVYKAKGYENTWNGVANVNGVVNSGEVLPTGTYFYVLKINELGEDKTGWIYLGR